MQSIAGVPTCIAHEKAAIDVACKERHLRPAMLMYLVKQLTDEFVVHVHTVTVAIAGNTAVDAWVLQLAEQQPL